MKGRLVVLALVTLGMLVVPPNATSTGATLVVGHGYATIQEAVDAAQPGDTVRIPGGTYQEAVVVTTPHVTIRGDGRGLTVLDGGRFLGQAFTVTADGVSLESMTAQNYVNNAFAFTDVDGFRMYDLHAIDSGEYGLYAIHSKNGEISHSYAEGFSDGGIYIGETIRCDCDVHHNKAWNNMLGYSGTANSYVRIWENEFHNNRAGILMSVLPQEMGYDLEENAVYGTQVHTEIHHNYIHDNNDHTETSGVFSTLHPPVGEGITIAGGWFNHVHHNRLENNSLWGVGLFWLSTPPRGNVVHDNVIEGSRYGVWWDEMGEDNCFEGNALAANQIPSDPAPLPDCQGVLPTSGCPPALENWAACRASDARAPSALKLADLAWRSYTDAEPHESLLPALGP